VSLHQAALKIMADPMGDDMGRTLAQWKRQLSGGKLVMLDNLKRWYAPQTLSGNRSMRILLAAPKSRGANVGTRSLTCWLRDGACPYPQGQHLSLDTGPPGILGNVSHHPDVRVIALWNAIPAPCLSSQPKTAGLSP
jgi:hypothetical protein